MARDIAIDALEESDELFFCIGAQKSVWISNKTH